MNFSTATTKELVAAYNAAIAVLGGHSIVRFSDRKTAERRTADILAKLEEHRAREAAQAAIRKASRSSASAQIAASWRDPEVRAARLARVAVRVVDAETRGTADFPSVAKAFDALGLPKSKIIPLRMRLKESGAVEFGGFTFRAIAVE